MNFKKALILCIVTVIIVSTLSVVSAGWFDFLGGEKNATTINCTGGQESVEVNLYTPLPGNFSSVESELESSDYKVYVNVTDKNNNTENYTVNVHSWFTTRDNNLVDWVYNLDPGKYTVSAYFPGNSIFNASSWTGKVVVKEKEETPITSDDDDSSDDDSSSDPSNEVVSTETTHDGGLTTTTTTYADGHTKSVTNGVVYK